MTLPGLLAATYGQLGELALTTKALRELLAIRRNFTFTVQEELAKWRRPEQSGKSWTVCAKRGVQIADDPAPKT
jgi:hypothetical protein